MKSLFHLCSFIAVLTAAVALTSLPAAAADPAPLSLQRCTTAVGTMGAARYYTDDGGLRAAGTVHLTLGYTCPVWSGYSFSFIVTGFAGTYLDKNLVYKDNYEAPESTKNSQQVLGLTVGVDYQAKGEASIGGAWETGKGINDPAAYMIVFSYAIPTETLLDVGSELISGNAD